MKNLSLFIFTLLLFYANSLKANDNIVFIEKQFKKYKQIQTKVNFLPAKLFFKHDTVDISMLEFKEKDKKNYYLFCIVKTDLNELKYYTTSDIVGFTIKEEVYIHLDFVVGNYFVHQINTGKVNLYEKIPIPNFSNYLYFLNKKNDYIYHCLNPLECNSKDQFQLSKSPSIDGQLLVYNNLKGLPEAFKKFVYFQLGDCEKVKNMIKSDYYTIDDLGNLVSLYNKCF